MCRFVHFVGVKQVIIRGDGEHSLQSLLAVVVAKLRADGLEVQEPQATPVSDHGAIGSAERHHDIVGTSKYRQKYKV